MMDNETMATDNQDTADTVSVLDPVFLFQGMQAGARTAGQRRKDQT